MILGKLETFQTAWTELAGDFSELAARPEGGWNCLPGLMSSSTRVAQDRYG
jgi:hypothetical protein